MSTFSSLSHSLAAGPYLSLAFLLLIAIVIFLGIWIIRVEKKITKALGGGSRSLQETLSNLHDHTKGIEDFRDQLEKYLETVESRLNKNIQSVETIRFNPFKGSGSGGNQSFATTLLNEKGDGVVISSLYGRDRVSVFAKPIKKFISEFELSDEEKESLDKASLGLFKQKK